MHKEQDVEDAGLDPAIEQSSNGLLEPCTLGTDGGGDRQTYNGVVRRLVIEGFGSEIDQLFGALKDPVPTLRRHNGIVSRQLRSDAAFRPSDFDVERGLQGRTRQRALEHAPKS
ncbi:hypothetical protein JNW90_26055 [Micromonospora sp. STR1s_5]|nr:hypothetical protein [Micromonospora sp. STR1s_5]